MSAPTSDGLRDDAQLSKTLSYLLRHGALKEKLNVHSGGYVDVPDILNHFKNRYSEQDIERVIARDKKQRFGLRRNETTGCLQIRANQGHSFRVDDDGSLLEDVTNESTLTEVTHGTTAAAWPSIEKEGLRRMERNHLHFIPGRASGDHPMLPRYRGVSSVLIFVDVRSAVSGGIRFFRARNNVILSPGDERGCIPTKYFKQVIDTKTNTTLWPKRGQ